MLIPINDYFKKFSYDPLPDHGSPVTEVVWTSVGDLEIKGHRIYAGDSWAIAADSIEFPLPAGKYVITAECFAYGNDGRVARLRGLLPGRNADGTKLEGEFGVDVASAGVVDADAIDHWAQANEDEFERWCEDFTDSRLEDQSIAGFFHCPGAGVAMLHSSTGFGDGTYEAFTLLDGNEPVGFELVFLKSNQGYFDDDSEDAS